MKTEKGHVAFGSRSIDFSIKRSKRRKTISIFVDPYHRNGYTKKRYTVNKEFKRRTKPMEILAGESSAYRLLCFIALKMELGWRSVPINKPFKLQTLQLFTQNC